MNFPINPNSARFCAKDLRIAEQDETPLSRLEVLQGLREGSIEPGPVAKSFGFSSALVLRRKVIEFINFDEVAA